MNYKGSTAILYDKKDVKSFLKKNIKVKFFYPLTPSALSELINRNIENIISHENVLSENVQKKIIFNTNLYEKKFENYLNELNLDDVIIESVKNIFHIIITSSQFLYYSINNQGPWIILSNGKYELYNEKDVVFKNLFENIKSKKIDFFNIDSKKNSNFLIKYINFILNYLIFKLVNKKKIIWVTGLSYNFPFIIKSISQKNNKIFFLNYSSSNFSILKNLKTIYKIIFLKNKIIDISPDLNLEENTKFNRIQNINLILDTNFFQLISCEIENFLNSYILKNLSILNYTKKIVKLHQPKLLIAHHIRWMESISLASVFKKNNIPVFLISHGSHNLFRDEFSKNEIISNAKGLLGSNFANYIFTQTPESFELANKLYPRVKKIKTYPLMWASKNNLKKNIKKNDTFIKLLHASTPKLLGIRPWIYENSNEYVNNLKTLIKSIRKISNTKLVIRARENNELNLNDLKNILCIDDNDEQVVIKSDGSFIDDLLTSDMLISFSSTTIDESLYNFTPVILYSNSGRFNFLEESKEDSKLKVLYNLNAKNIDIRLKNILDNHINKKIDNNQFYRYIWSNQVKNFDEFVDLIIDSCNR